MVRRSKRSMTPHKAGEMKEAVRQFETQMRRWAAVILMRGFGTSTWNPRSGITQRHPTRCGLG